MGSGRGYVEAGLPSHDHVQRAYFESMGGVRSLASGTSSSGGSPKTIPQPGASGPDILYTGGTNNSIYGKSSTVQPPATKTYWVIKY